MIEVPFWFSLESYTVAENFSPQLWHENLISRAASLSPSINEDSVQVPLKGRLVNNPPKLIVEPRNNRFGDARSVWELRRLDAYLSIVNDEFHPEIIKWLYDGEGCPPDMQMFRKGEITITDYTKADLKPYQMENLKKLVGDETYHRAERLNAAGNFESSFSGDIESISIWLELPDELIIQDFKDWLSKRRLEKPLGKQKSHNPLFKKWHDFKILAYLDLKIWAKFEDLDIPNHKIGELLFPDDIEVDTTERVRKVVKPLALNAISKKTTTWLTCINRNEKK